MCSGLCGLLGPCRGFQGMSSCLLGQRLTLNPSRDTAVFLGSENQHSAHQCHGHHPGVTQPPSPQFHTHGAHKSLRLCLPGALEIPMASPLLSHLLGLQDSPLLGQPSAGLHASSLLFPCSPPSAPELFTEPSWLTHDPALISSWFPLPWGEAGPRMALCPASTSPSDSLLP